MTGGPPAEVEQCLCPPGYRGLACEECAEPHTRQGGACVAPAQSPAPEPHNPRVRQLVRPQQPRYGGHGEEEASGGRHGESRQPTYSQRMPGGYGDPQEDAMKGYPRPRTRPVPPPEEAMKGYPRPRPSPEVGKKKYGQLFNISTISTYIQYGRARAEVRPPPSYGSSSCPAVAVTVEPQDQTIPQVSGYPDHLYLQQLSTIPAAGRGGGACVWRGRGGGGLHLGEGGRGAELWLPLRHGRHAGCQVWPDLGHK